MEDIKKDLKDIKSDIVEIKMTLARNTGSLEEHMARTQAAESRLNKLEFGLLGFLASALIALFGILLRK